MAKVVSDYLQIAADPQYRKVVSTFGNASEELLFSDMVIKINRKDRPQERILVVTDAALYNLNKQRKMKRRIPLGAITGLTASLLSDEFVIHVPSEYDYRISSGHKAEAVECIASARQRLLGVPLTIHDSGATNLKTVTVTRVQTSAKKPPQAGGSSAGSGGSAGSPGEPPAGGTAASAGGSSNLFGGFSLGRSLSARLASPLIAPAASSSAAAGGDDDDDDSDVGGGGRPTSGRMLLPPPHHSTNASSSSSSTSAAGYSAASSSHHHQHQQHHYGPGRETSASSTRMLLRETSMSGQQGAAGNNAAAALAAAAGGGSSRSVISNSSSTAPSSSSAASGGPSEGYGPTGGYAHQYSSNTSNSSSGIMHAGYQQQLQQQQQQYGYPNSSNNTAAAAAAAAASGVIPYGTLSLRSTGAPSPQLTPQQQQQGSGAGQHYFAISGSSSGGGAIPPPHGDPHQYYHQQQPAPAAVASSQYGYGVTTSSAISGPHHAAPPPPPPPPAQYSQQQYQPHPHYQQQQQSSAVTPRGATAAAATSLPPSGTSAAAQRSSHLSPGRVGGSQQPQPQQLVVDRYHVEEDALYGQRSDYAGLGNSYSYRSSTLADRMAADDVTATGHRSGGGGGGVASVLAAMPLSARGTGNPISTAGYYPGHAAVHESQSLRVASALGAGDVSGSGSLDLKEVDEEQDDEEDDAVAELQAAAAAYASSAHNSTGGGGSSSISGQYHNQHHQPQQQQSQYASPYGAVRGAGGLSHSNSSHSSYASPQQQQQQSHHHHYSGLSAQSGAGSSSGTPRQTQQQQQAAAAYGSPHSPPVSANFSFQHSSSGGVQDNTSSAAASVPAGGLYRSAASNPQSQQQQQQIDVTAHHHYHHSSGSGGGGGGVGSGGGVSSPRGGGIAGSGSYHSTGGLGASGSASHPGSYHSHHHHGHSHGHHSHSRAGSGGGGGTPSLPPVTGWSKADSPVGLESFELLRVIGRGSYGKVLQVRKRDSGEVYAMKVLSKALVVKRNQVEHTQAERAILESIDHPFLIKLRYAFQTPTKLYLVLPYLRGGEVFYHLKQKKRLELALARFYVAEIVLGVGHLHAVGIVYRDIKPENVLLDAEGHVKLTDFGLSKVLARPSDTTRTFCGTPEYLAPEVVDGCAHDKGVDWWGLGVLLWEFLTGLPPFYHPNLQTMYDMIRTATLEFPPDFTPDTRDFIARLLERDPTRRLGNVPGDGDVEAVKAHPFFGGIDWEALYARRIDPPWRPAIKPTDAAGDTGNFDREFTSEPVLDSVVSLHSSGLLSTSAPRFDGFTYQAPSGILSSVMGGAGGAGAVGGSYYHPSALAT